MSRKLHFWHWAAATCLWILSITATSAEILLINGDRLTGEIEDQSPTQVTWNSDSFGALNIPVENIVTIDGMPFVPVTQQRSSQSTSIEAQHYFQGNVSITGAFASGNQRREDWDSAINLNWHQDSIQQGLQFNYESHHQQELNALKEYGLRYDIDWFITNDWFWKNTLEWGVNDYRAIDQFYTLGSALGVQLWQRDSSSLSTETGLLWIDEQFPDDSASRRVSWSWSSDYRRRLFAGLELHNNHKLIVSLEDTQDSELELNLSVRAPLANGFFTEIRYEWVYDNLPIADSRSVDSQLTVGINYDWSQ